MSAAEVDEDPLLRQLRRIDSFRVLGPVVLLARVGAGGMGVVYRAYHPVLDREVAVKVLRPSLAADESFVARFHREAALAAELDHPNVVRVFEVRFDEGLHFMVMEFVDGETIPQRVERWGGMREGEAVMALLGAASGLAVAHARGIVHRDIKPENLMIARDGTVKLTDLGLAKQAIGVDGRTIGGASMLMGTPQYMSPEHWHSPNVRPAADVWALGATLFYLLTGRAAVPPASPLEIGLWISGQDLPGLTVAQIGREVRPELQAIYRRCIARAPGERFVDAGELAVALAGLRIADPLLLRAEQLAPDRPRALEPELTPTLRHRLGSRWRALRVRGRPRDRRRGRRGAAGSAVAVAATCLGLVLGGGVWWLFGRSSSARAADGEAATGPVSATDDELEVEAREVLAAEQRATLTALLADAVRTQPPLPADLLRPLAADTLLVVLEPWPQVATSIRVQLVDPATGRVIRADTGVATGGVRFGDLADGGYRLAVTMVEAGGGESEPFQRDFFVDHTPPRLEVAIPPWTAGDRVAVVGIAEGGERVAVAPLPPVMLGVDGKFELQVPVPPGGAELLVVAADRAGNQVRRQQMVRVDRQPPVIEWMSPPPFAAVPGRVTVLVRVPVTPDEAPIRAVAIDGEAAEALGDGQWRCAIAVSGPRRVTVVAVDAAGNQGRHLRLLCDPDLTDAALQQPIEGPAGLTLLRLPVGEFRRVLPRERRSGRIAAPIWVGRTEVTRRQWCALDLPAVDEWGRELDDLPANFVSRDDSVRFCRRLEAHLRTREFLPEGYEVCLPNEVEWEYAARAGCSEPLWPAAVGDRLPQFAALRALAPVGGRAQNAFGLQDVLGNVEEWCSDPQPLGGVAGDGVLRGGSYSTLAAMMDLGLRRLLAPTVRVSSSGFRVVMVNTMRRGT